MAGSDIDPRPRRVRRALAAFAALGLAAPSLGLAVAAEPEEAACPVIASAQGVQVLVSKSDNLFLRAPSGFVVPAAQACVDLELAVSNGFASAPYPGETVVTVPPLVRGLTGAPVPDYPPYASSAHPRTEKAEISQPGFLLRSQSTEFSSAALAQTGLAQPDASQGATAVQATALVDPERKLSEATATSDTQPLTINDVLRLGQVRSVASVKVDADGKLLRTTMLQIGRTEVAGQVVEITPQGVQVPGQMVPLPDSDPLKALEAAGVSIRYVAAEETERGVLSAGLQVVATREELGGVVTTQYTFGRAFAAADVVQERNRSTVPDAPSFVTQPDDEAAGGESTLASGLSGVAAPANDGGEQPQAVAGPAPEASMDSASSPPAPTRLQSAGSGAPPEFGLLGVYLLIVFASLATFTSGMWLRLLGVRTR